MIENYLGALPASGAANFALAGSICTDFAAFYTGISLPPLKDQSDERARAENIREFKASADRDLARLLTAPTTIGLPKSTTG